MHIDPALFRDDAVSDETRAMNEFIRQQLSALPKTSDLEPEQIRRDRRDGRTIWGPVVHSDRARTVTIDGPGGPLHLRVIEADDPTGVYVHCHGGGWVHGAADLSDQGNEILADAAGVTVVSIDYRLAPEHPFPAGVEDCIAGATWVVEHAEEEFGTDRLSIGGESAGANLAAATLVAVRERTGFRGWVAANLVYGSYFPLGTPSVVNWDVDGLILDADTMTWFGEHYNPWPATSTAAFDTRLSPLYADLTGMPPALFTVGTWDPLVDDTLFMATRWVTAGLETELALYPGGIHAFDAFPMPIAVEARDRMHRFIADRSRP